MSKLQRWERRDRKKRAERRRMPKHGMGLKRLLELEILQSKNLERLKEEQGIKDDSQDTK